MRESKERLIVALDYPDLPAALAMARRLADSAGMFKVGLELFNAAGPAAIESIRKLGPSVFYDSKLYDIPNTVAGAAAAIARMGVSMFNIHALGGTNMMAAARTAAVGAAAEAGLPPPLVIAVTIVTSLGDSEVRGELGLPEDASGAAVRLATLAREAGLDGVVASVREVAEIKRACGKKFLTVTPGIRPAWAAKADQSRVATPTEAIQAGSDYLVVGRPITQSDDPARSVSEILREIEAATG